MWHTCSIENKGFNFETKPKLIPNSDNITLYMYLRPNRENLYVIVKNNNN